MMLQGLMNLKRKKIFDPFIKTNHTFALNKARQAQRVSTL